MGPFASPFTVVSTGRRWLALLVIPAAAMVGHAIDRARLERPTAAVATLTARDAAAAQLADLAQAHRHWVADHGSGCARTTEHLVPYTTRPDALDPWGTPIVLTCDRIGTTTLDQITVEVRSSGPDRLRNTADDLTAFDQGTVSTSSTSTAKDSF